MNKTVLIIVGLAASFSLGFFSKSLLTKQTATDKKTNQSAKNHTIKKEGNMKLGAFSVSLNVKDLQTSKEFYENLGFVEFAGGMDKNYLIMKNENSLIGLFQGMFEGNILTFNPGWDENAQNIQQFDDVREIQRELKGKGVKLMSKADEKTSGPASIMITDPDGNVIYIDQHR